MHSEANRYTKEKDPACAAVTARGLKNNHDETIIQMNTDLSIEKNQAMQKCIARIRFGKLASAGARTMCRLSASARVIFLPVTEHVPAGSIDTRSGVFQDTSEKSCWQRGNFTGNGLPTLPMALDG